MNHADPRIPEFERAVGLSALPDRGPMATIVDWSAHERPPGIDQSWTASGRDLSISNPEGATSLWSFRRESKAFVAVNVFVSSVDYAAARRELVSAAALSSTPTIPHQPLALGVGELCVGVVGQTRASVLWVNRNACFRVKVTGAGVDIPALVKALDGMANPLPFTELATRRPGLTVDLGDSRITTEGSTELQLHPSGLPAGVPPTLQVRPQGAELFVDALSGTLARIGARRPGPGVLLVGVVDPTTMLSRVTTVEVEVVEPPA